MKKKKTKDKKKMETNKVHLLMTPQVFCTRERHLPGKIGKRNTFPIRTKRDVVV